jgi:hypothetical protein
MNGGATWHRWTSASEQAPYEMGGMSINDILRAAMDRLGEDADYSDRELVFRKTRDIAAWYEPSIAKLRPRDLAKREQ